MRIGHTRLSRGYLMAKEKAPFYEVCEVQLSVKHIVTECLKYERDRYRIKMNENFDIALKPEKVDNIKMLLFFFFKSTNLYNLIKKIYI